MKKKAKYNQNSAIRGALRRAFARSPIVIEVINKSRKEEPRYKTDGTRHKKNWVKRECQVCNQWYPSSKISVDHIHPVVSVEEGFQDWNEFVARLWCDPSNLQRICDPCHDKKTQSERIARLLIKYDEELTNLEHMIMVQGIIPSDWKKLLAKYIAKKKTIGLESVVQRAQALKEQIKKNI